jgi:hypothetical protein
MPAFRAEHLRLVGVFDLSDAGDVWFPTTVEKLEVTHTPGRFRVLAACALR